MKKAVIVLIAIIVAGISITSCQKAKEPEGKKEAETQKQEVQAQKEEVKKQPSETKPIEAKPETTPKQQTQLPATEQTAMRETVQITSPSEEPVEFKEPVLLWEKEFDPPIREISDQNSNGDFLAVQVKKEEGSGMPLMTKLLVIDSKGKTKREELLPEKKKVEIPAEQLWLTAIGDEQLEQLKKAKKPKTIEAWQKEMYISGNGEYYAIVMQHGNWYEFEYKDKNGKTLWKINPKDNYGFWKAYISPDGSRIVIIDMGGLSGGDVWEVFGQRVYFYDNTGKLLKDYDFGERMEEWIDVVRFSIDSKYIGILSKKVADKTIAKFLDNNGKLLWTKEFEKDFFYMLEVANNGHLFLEGRENLYSLDKKGDILWSRSFIKSRFCWYTSLTDDGGYVFISEDEDFFIYDNSNGNEVLKVNINTLLNLEETYSGWVGCGNFSPAKKYLIFPYAYLHKKHTKTLQEKEGMFKVRRGLLYTKEERKAIRSIALFNLKEKKIVWMKKDYAQLVFTKFDKGKEMIKLLGDGYENFRKVTVFDWRENK